MYFDTLGFWWRILIGKVVPSSFSVSGWVPKYLYDSGSHITVGPATASKLVSKNSQEPTAKKDVPGSQFHEVHLGKDVF